MIGYLRGKIKYIGPNRIILDVKGVGYKIQNLNCKNQNDNAKLKIADEVELYIYHHIREDRQELYGFSIMEELQTFELLLGVPGVGPKMAMKILSKTGVDKLKEAISKGDSALLTAISGIGKKMAMKILVELKHKISSDAFDSLDTSEASLELIEAMETLGYNKKEISSILSKMPEDLTTTQEKIKWVLKALS